MDKKTKYILIGSIIALIIPLLFFILSFLTCTSDFGCLILYILPLSPGIIITNILGLTGENNSFLSLITSILFYSLIGALISWLIYYIKYERKSK